MPLNPISIDQAISKFIDKPLSYDSIEPYKHVYGEYKALRNDYREILNGLGENLLQDLVHDRIVKIKIQNTKILLSLFSIAQFKLKVGILNENYTDILEALKQMGMTKNLNASSHLHRFIYLHDNKHLNLVMLEHEINKKKYFVEKKKFKEFLNAHINLIQAAEMMNVELSTLRQYWLFKYDKPIIRFHHANPFLCYVNTKEWKIFCKERRKFNLLSKEKSSNMLGISSDNFNKVAAEYNLKKEKFRFNIESATYYSENDIKMLKNKQEKLWNYIRKNYYTSQETINLLGIAYSTLSSKFYTKRIQSIHPPPLVRINKDNLNLRSSGSLLLYSKSNVDNLKKELNDKRKYEDILYKLIDTPINIFYKVVEETKLTFHENGIETKKLWFQYVSNKLNKSKASDTTKRKDIQILYSTTLLLAQLTKQKEIYNFSTQEILFSVFNSNITKSVQTEIYKFLKKLSDSRQNTNKSIKFKHQILPNPYKNDRSSSSDKEVYPLSDYLALLDYVKDTTIHKTLAIHDVLNQIDNDTKKLKQVKCYHYDSAWLYVLLHLNNAWRHSDITLFPRINLSNTRLKNQNPLEALNWLKKNDFNSYEITNIVNQAKSFPLFHSKTNKKRYFFCSNELMSSFAHVTAICELRTQIIRPLSNYIIDLDNRKMVFKTVHAEKFFNGFNKDFTFKSTQMNRTIISLIYSVIKKTTNRNPLEITKYIRSHSSEETTNIYIDIPQEQMDFITTQLFDLGNFGYIYDTLSEMLIGNLPKDRLKRTKIALKTKEIFGDVYQIETMASYFKQLAKEQESINKMLYELTIEERTELVNLINLKQLPARKEGFQCIFADCPFPTRDCTNCQFAIPHFHTLSQLSKDFELFLQYHQKNMPETLEKGEKIHLANILYSYLNLIEQAIKRFGKEAVSNFFEGGIEGLKQVLIKIPSSKQLVTIPKLR
ncbi:hypothetical protein SAMN04487919_104321 [Bacillus sp. ok061]|uniref:hypothetical protein n=1 Tax=Bacillus sp. ok061 TaxID=1761766 RepID=UPI00089EB87F|nr:hypothetical protein [Bacillus sp. ok061]SEG01447.1 hypothetical protein SAMN04487919_104321 [Bacillus sp. ok061]